MRALKYILLAASVLLPKSVAAQTTDCKQTIDLTSSLLSDSRRTLARALSVTQSPRRSDFLRAASMSDVFCADSVKFLARWQRRNAGKPVEVLPLEGSIVTNSAYPRSINDGAAWQGVGYTLGATAGARGRHSWLNWQIAPEFYYQSNGDFTFIRGTRAGYSSYNNPYQRSIDYATRFGDQPFSTLSPGQSYLQLHKGAWSLTGGTENLWIGAAQVYPILMSYTAPGFPHIRIGTQRKVSVPLFDVEVQGIMGTLQESAYFDTLTTNNDHFFGTAMVVLSPRFMPGFSLGVARAVHDSASIRNQSPWFFVQDLISSPFGGNFHSGNTYDTNALAAVMGRWVLPESGFEAYAEWSREDTPEGFLDLLREPDWTQAYVVGFSKSYLSDTRLWRVYGELNHLGESAPSRAGRGYFSYYTHSVVLQGHTNRGQLLGAAIGPGSDVQQVGADIFSASGRTGFYIERTRYDDDTYYRSFARRWGETRHDAEVTASALRTQLVGPLELTAGLAVSRRFGRQFIPLDGSGIDLIETNLHFSLYGSWNVF